MGLEMSDATYARSKTGSDKLINNLQGDIDRIIAKLKVDGENFKKMEKVIRANWVGKDCDRYIKDITTKVNSISKSLTGLKSAIQSTIDNDRTNFLKAQKSGMYK